MKKLLVMCSLIFLIGCQTQEGAMEMTIWQAIEQNDIEAVQAMLGDIDVNMQDEKGRTPLMYATYQNQVEIAEILIDAGADVNKQDDMLNSPFLYAGAEGYKDIVRMTIEAGADPTITNRYGGVAVIPAAEHGYVDVIELLLNETTIDVNHINDLGWTALLEAIILNDGDKTQQQVVEMLIEHGADVHIADSNGVTPLAHAKERGFDEIVEILIKAGATH